MKQALGKLPLETQNAVRERAATCITTYKPAIETATYACPLFEKGTGCLVHETAKPLPCIAHACYESQTDLPPDELLDAAELAIHSLNIRTYGKADPLVPIPLAIDL